LSLVIDASIALSWQFDDESSPYAERALDAVMAEGAFVPFHWKAEVANGLVMGIRRKRISVEDQSQIVSDLEELKFEHDIEGLEKVWNVTSQMAITHGLTVNDAIYLELAVRRGLKIATLDAKLQAASESLGVNWIGVTS
jgi:predicted nucleic acid-binding protein